MQHRGIVPDDDVAAAPAIAEDVLGPRRLDAEPMEQLDRLAVGHAVDPDRHLVIEIERLAAGDRMGPHHRVPLIGQRRLRRSRRAGHRLFLPAQRAQPVDAISLRRCLRGIGGVEMLLLLVAVDGPAAGQPALLALRQRLVGRVHVGEQGLAAFLRHVDGIEQRGDRRLALEGVIGMPMRAGAVTADRSSRPADIGQDIDLGAIRQAVGVGEEGLELAEIAGEGHELLRRQRLVANC